MKDNQGKHSRPASSKLVYNVFFPPIDEDVAMGGVVTKEKVITQDQYLDLVYY